MSAASADDHRYMARAIRLARKGLYSTDPNPRVGCVVVREDRIIGEGYHVRAGQPHAEVNALAEAAEDARGATAYVSLEPCCHHGRTPPCTEALIAAGVRRVVYADSDPDPRVHGAGEQQLRAAGIDVTGGVLRDQAAELNPGFRSRMLRGRPWVRSKIAASLDGRTALANGQSQWITGEAARADVHRWRARSSAVLTGAGTIQADDPRLNARLSGQPAQSVLQPVRIVADARLRTPPTARVFEVAAPVVLAHCAGAEGDSDALRECGATLIEFPADDRGRVDLDALMKRLAKDGYNEVLVEAGPTLNGALLEAGLIDELIVYLAPVLLGDAARGMFTTAPLEDMERRFGLRWIDTRRFGDDLRMRFRAGDTED